MILTLLLSVQKLKDSMGHLPPAVQMRIMSDNYGSDDKDLQLCCFPGCSLPKSLGPGDDNPWYWYDSKRTLQKAASAEVVHTF